MKIRVAKSAGFCFGVKRALDIALKTTQAHTNAVMLGDIVHNEDVICAIEKEGIKKIKRLKDGKNKTLLIRAHGASQAIFKKAKRLGYKVIDATCPMVREIHDIAKRMEQKGYSVIIIGDKKHDEVSGIVGQLKNKALIIDDIKDIRPMAVKKIKKACVVVQSTQNLQKALKIAAQLKRLISDLEFFNTICGPTRKKQSEIKSMPLKNDAMVIIGSKTSANTRRLYEISKALNKRTYWVQYKEDLKKEWFKNARSIGVTAGASTPDGTTLDIVACLENLSA
jgi:4-hydroxy-3-methylbut-2-enyl diphosphate reductase